MGSSNRHWPSMFKSKPNFQDHQWQQSHGSNHHLSSATNRSSPYTSGCDERTPEPKPRWNPKPEQIRILESIFNSGMVNPPRDEIRRIRARLQEYGQVGDANVFYWFQNRKSRSKNKNRQLPRSQNHQTQYGVAATKAATTTASSSSSSDKSSSKSIEFLLNSPTVSVNQQPQTYLGGGGTSSRSHQQHLGEFFQEPFYFPVLQQQVPQAPTTSTFTQGFCFSDLGAMINQENHHANDNQRAVSSSEMLLTDLMMNHQYGIPSKNAKNKDVDEGSIMKMLTHATTPSLATTSLTQQPPACPTSFVPPAPTIVLSANNDIQGVGEAGTGKSVVFINDVPFELGVGPFNVKEVFGSDAVLFDSTGQNVVTNEWGVTTQSLQHGAFYYLVRSFGYDHAGTIDLI
ncbi:homeodomain-like protein [Artemisia annua]|uniref:Protein WUSCHEL n=1 Tax=Artemisia annua TaxID=35608 RepID=A0A2U1P8U2_ARTAN|nr:homeodomain-like protein [Artemisia annua]